MKLKEVQKILRKKNIDLLFLVHPDPHITWLTQKDTSYSFLLITPSKADFYISKLDHVDKVLGMTVKTIDKKWKTKFKNLKVKNVAINKESLTAAFLDTVKELYPKVKIHNFHEELSVLRAVKTDAEI